MYLKIFALASFIFFSQMAPAQEHNPAQATEPHDGLKNSIRVGVGIGHAHITKAVSRTEEYGISAASWYLDTDYYFTNHWGIGIHSDIILENYLIEEHVGSHQSNILERNSPIAIVPVLTYKPWNHLVFVGGYGWEFSKEENLNMLRGGLEYGWHLPHNWELGISAMYDIKLDAYDTWMIGLGVSKFFHLGHKEH